MVQRSNHTLWVGSKYLSAQESQGAEVIYAEGIFGSSKLRLGRYLALLELGSYTGGSAKTGQITTTAVRATACLLLRCFKMSRQVRRTFVCWLATREETFLFGLPSAWVRLRRCSHLRSELRALALA